MQNNLMSFFIKAFKGSIFTYKCNNYFSFVCVILLPQYKQISRRNSSIYHTITKRSQHKKFSVTEYTLRQRKTLFNIFFCKVRLSASYLSNKRSNSNFSFIKSLGSVDIS